jgi:HEAT repeat protein
MNDDYLDERQRHVKWKEYQAELIHSLIKQETGNPDLRHILRQLAHKHRHQRSDAILELTKHNEPCVVKYLIILAGDHDDEADEPHVNWQASAALIGLGEIAVEPTIAFIQSASDTNENEKWARYFILWAMGKSRDERYITCLLQMVNTGVAGSCVGLGMIIDNGYIGKYRDEAMKALAAEKAQRAKLVEAHESSHSTRLLREEAERHKLIGSQIKEGRSWWRMPGRFTR